LTRAGQRHPLLLAAGELRGPAFGEVAQPDHLEHLVDALGDGGSILLLAARAIGDVVPHGHVWEQRVMLKDRIDVTLVRRDLRDVHALESDGSGSRALESGDHPQGSRLTASGWAEHGEEFTGADRKISVGHRNVVRETLGHVVDLDDR